MAVADEAEGWAEAQRRIAVCRETQADTLDLGGLRLTRVPEELAGLIHLTSLDLRRNAVGADGARSLACLVNLTSLDLEGNWIGADGARALAGLVNLTSLKLGGNWIGADGARALAGLVNLTSLDLRFNAIGADGARVLAGLVNLTSLNLGDNEIGADGARVLAGLVNLTSLNLRDNEIGVDGARALSGLVNLTSLDLSSTGVKDLSPLLQLGKVRELNCSGCQLDDAIPALWMMPSLVQVILHEAALPGVPAEVLSPTPTRPASRPCAPISTTSPPAKPKWPTSSS